MILLISTFRNFNLDHVGALVPELAGGGGPGTHTGQVQDGDVVKNGRSGKVRHGRLLWIRLKPPGGHWEEGSRLNGQKTAVCLYQFHPDDNFLSGLKKDIQLFFVFENPDPAVSFRVAIPPVMK